MTHLKKLSVGWALVVGMAIGAGAALAGTTPREATPPAADPNGCSECVKNVDCDAVCGAGFGVCSWNNGCRRCLCSG